MNEDKCSIEEKCSGCGCKKCSCCCCCTNAALSVSGVIFGIIALIHLYRIFYFFPIIIGTTPVSDGASIAVFLIAGLLSIWMFWTVCKRCCAAKHCKDHHYKDLSK